LLIKIKTMARNGFFYFFLKYRMNFILFLFAFIMGLNYSASAQAKFTIEVAITVFDVNKKLEGAIVKVIKDGQEGEVKTTDKLGRAQVILLPNHEYLLVITKKGYISKSIEMNTKGMPEATQGAMVYRTKPEVEIFPIVEGMDLTIYEKPIGKFLFDLKNDDFYFDFNYTGERQAKISDAKDEFAQKQKEKQEVKANYDLIIAQADKAFGSKDYIGARTTYTEAQALLPGEAYPNQKIAEIDALLASALEARRKADKDHKEKAAAEEKRKADELAKLFAAEDAKLKAIEKTEADQKQKQEIEKDNKNKTVAENEPKRKVDEEAKRKAYDQIILKADQFFKANEYNAAKAAYSEALALFNEKYPRDRIAEIERMLAKMNSNANPGTRDRSNYATDLAKKYPQGITEEITQEANRKITRRIVVKGNDAADYTRISYSWGTYYFKNGDIPISEGIWNAETK
jgi:hypothetical protein